MAIGGEVKLSLRGICIGCKTKANTSKPRTNDPQQTVHTTPPETAAVKTRPPDASQ